MEGPVPDPDVEKNQENTEEQNETNTEEKQKHVIENGADKEDEVVS